MKTDARLQQDVMAELRWEPSVRAATVAASVRAGIVTLAGMVASHAEKWSAERAAKRVDGVRGVMVLLTVRPPRPGQRSDADIAHAAHDVMAWLVVPTISRVAAGVQDGWVTLTGAVTHDFQRQAALQAVRLIPGVRGVTDRIDLAPAPEPPDAPSPCDIAAAIQRRVPAGLPPIVVRVHGASVTLTGTVGSRAQRELATHAAWCQPGVRQVLDRLQQTA